MNPHRRPLADLDRLKVPDDWTAILRRPVQPRGDPPDSWLARASAGFVALAVAGAALAFWLRAYTTNPSPRDTSTPGVTAELPLAGLWIWPDNLPKLQSSANEEHTKWALDPNLVARRFADEVLEWGPDGYALDASQSGAQIDVRLTNDQSGVVEHLILGQPLKSGEGGVWAIEQVRGDGLSLAEGPGELVANGHRIHASASLSDGELAWGYSSGGLQRCRFASKGAAPGIEFDIEISLASNDRAGTNCEQYVPTHVWLVATEYSLLEIDAPANPLVSYTGKKVWWIQGVEATTSANLAAGVSKSSVFRGLAFNRAATVSRSF